MFFLKYLSSYIVGVRLPSAIGAVFASGNDELQCRPVPAESAGGLRADPEDRKRHIRRRLQGKTAVRETEREFHDRTEGASLALHGGVKALGCSPSVFL